MIFSGDRDSKEVVSQKKKIIATREGKLSFGGWFAVLGRDPRTPGYADRRTRFLASYSKKNLTTLYVGNSTTPTLLKIRCLRRKICYYVYYGLCRRRGATW